MKRSEALKLLHEKMKNQNLRKHCYAVESAMRGLAKRFKEDEEVWGIAGLLHDADYEIVKDDPQKHTHLTLEWLQKLEVEQLIKDAIISHAWGYVDGNPEPKTKMDWSLYCSDELTGLIIAVALVKPEKKLSSVTVESVMKKWKEKSFAKGVHRDQIEMCEGKLGIALRDFIEIVLNSMQAIAPDLGL